MALKAQKIMFKTLSGSSRFCLGGLHPSDVHDAHCSGALMGFKICGKSPGWLLALPANAGTWRSP